MPIPQEIVEHPALRREFERIHDAMWLAWQLHDNQPNCEKAWRSLARCIEPYVLYLDETAAAWWFAAFSRKPPHLGIAVARSIVEQAAVGATFEQRKTGVKWAAISCMAAGSSAHAAS